MNVTCRAVMNVNLGEMIGNFIVFIPTVCTAGKEKEYERTSADR